MLISPKYKDDGYKNMIEKRNNTSSYSRHDFRKHIFFENKSNLEEGLRYLFVPSCVDYKRRFWCISNTSCKLYINIPGLKKYIKMHTYKQYEAYVKSGASQANMRPKQ